MKLTIEEKSVVSHYLSQEVGLKAILAVFWPWLVPPLALSIYGAFYLWCCRSRYYQQLYGQCVSFTLCFLVFQ